MLSHFDWLRRSQTGAELLATLDIHTNQPDLLPADGEEIGPPVSAVEGPCERCWVYPCLPRYRYCKTCRAILARANQLRNAAYHAIVIWGHVNQLSPLIRMGDGFQEHHILGVYIHDQNHFLLMMPRRELKTWLQELILYHGPALRGLLQVVPTTMTGKSVRMGEVVVRTAYLDSRFPMDRLRVRFYAAPYQVLVPHTREEQGLLTFEASEFLSLLEMAAVFRTILRPQEQATLRELLNLKDAAEAQFYWGRFVGQLSQEAKDMLSGWRVRQWPKNRVQLLYELADYVAFYQTD